MKLCLLFFLMTFTNTPVDIYSFVIKNTEGNNIKLSDFEQKKILLVNIATNSPRVNQLRELQQLQDQYGDSLVVIGFPTNSFSNENRTDAEIKQFCQGQYGANFLIAAKGAVTGTDIQPLYSWLIHESQNGVLESEVKGDFQKYLIDKNGNLLGVFSGSVSPLSKQLIYALTAVQN